MKVLKMDEGLKCPVEGCRKVIHGMTGLDELQKLSTHMKRVHGRGDGYNVFDAMTFRDMSENNVQTKEGLIP
jgi:hypothetical protein